MAKPVEIIFQMLLMQSRFYITVYYVTLPYSIVNMKIIVTSRLALIQVDHLSTLVIFQWQKLLLIENIENCFTRFDCSMICNKMALNLKLEFLLTGLIETRTSGP